MCHESQRQALQGGGRGRIIDRSFDLKAAMDGVILISGSSLFHSDMQLGKKLD